MARRTTIIKSFTKITQIESLKDMKWLELLRRLCRYLTLGSRNILKNVLKPPMRHTVPREISKYDVSTRN